MTDNTSGDAFRAIPVSQAECTQGLLGHVLDDVITQVSRTIHSHGHQPCRGGQHTWGEADGEGDRYNWSQDTPIRDNAKGTAYSLPHFRVDVGAKSKSQLEDTRYHPPNVVSNHRD